MRRCKVCGYKLDGQERVVPVVSVKWLIEYTKRQQGKYTKAILLDLILEAEKEAKKK